MLKLVVDRTELKIVLEFLERGLGLDELDIELRRPGRIIVAQIGAKQTAPFATAGLARLVAIEREAEGGALGRTPPSHQSRAMPRWLWRAQRRAS
jgi:hypothetical protein